MEYGAWSEYIRSLGPEAVYFMVLIGVCFIGIVLGMREEWRRNY